jgi:Ca-activated chloride channel family protein
MRVEVLQGHTSLPAAASLEVAVLVKLAPEPSTTSPGAGPGTLHLGLCLDTSGSMGEQAGLHGGQRMKKLDALKQAVQGALPLLERWQATVTAYGFSDAAERLCARKTLQGAQDTHKLSRAVHKLAVSGGTCAKAAMLPVVQALEPLDHPVRRLVLVTDGQFNSDSVKPCRVLAQRAGEAGIAVWTFATGTSYDEPYLRDLAGLGAAGGLSCHVSDLGLLHDKLEEELGALVTATNGSVEVVLQPGAGCTVLEATRLTPVQVGVAPRPDGSVRDRLDVLDARGQAYVLRVGAQGLAVGHHALLTGLVRAHGPSGPQTHPVSVDLDVLPAGSAVAAPQPQVLTTVLSVKAAQATVLGNAALATRLYAAAGQTDLAAQLQSLGTALPQGTDAARALRTQVLGSTRLVALGSAHAGKPADTHGGPP